MRRRLFLLVAVGIVPGLAFLIASYARTQYDTQWAAGLLAYFGPLSADDMAAASLAALCGTNNPEVADLCRDYVALDWLTVGALLAAALGVALLGFIWYVGWRAQGDRGSMLRAFKPALTITVWGLIALVALLALVTMGTLYVAESVFLGWISPFIILAIGGAALIAIVGMARAMLSATRPLAEALHGRTLTRTGQPRLLAFVDQIAADLGAEPPDAVVAGLKPAFFATEATVDTVDGRLTGRTVYLSLPLCRVLTADELRAVVGHELAHFRGEDTAWSRRFFPIYRGATGALTALRASRNGLSAIATVPAEMLVSSFVDQFETMQAEVSRERELAADAASAGITGAAVAATALVKLVASDGAWERTMDRLGERLAGGEESPNVAALFLANVRLNREAGLPHGDPPLPTDTHPPASMRLNALGVAYDEIAENIRVARPGVAARTLFDAPDALEADLSAELSARIAPKARAMADAAARQREAEAWVNAHEQARGSNPT